MYYLGIDLGTSSVKTLLIDSNGCVVRKGVAAVGRYESAGLSVEQDIFEIYSAVCDATGQITNGVGSDKIVSVGISSQGGAIVPLDENLLPVCKVISWLDSRGLDYDKQLTEKFSSKFFAKHTGHPKSIMFPGQFLRLKTEQPEFFAKIKQWGFVGDVIVGMLTGKRAHDYTSLSIAGLLNPQSKIADPDLLDGLGLTETHLPELAEGYSVAGTVTQQAAEQTGLKKGTVVSPAIHDQYAAAIAADVTHRGDVMIATGTAWVLLAVGDKLIPPIVDNAFACPHPTKGLFGQMIPLGTGGSVIEWLMRTIGIEKFSISDVDELLQKANPQSKIEIGPVWECGVDIKGISINDQPEDLIQAGVVALAKETDKQLNNIKQSGIEINRLVLTGTAAKSEATHRIIEQTTRLKTDRFTEPAASAYGAALIAKKINES